MERVEYKVLVLKIEKRGLWSQHVVPDFEVGIEQTLNSLGEQGWELAGVFPFTNGGSPAEIEEALHYFRRFRACGEKIDGGG